MFLHGLFLTFVWGGTSLPIQPLQCPIGTTITSPIFSGVRFRGEFCIDLLGQKQGPMRVIRSRDGALILEGQYLNSKLDGILHAYDEDGSPFTDTTYRYGSKISEVVRSEAKEKMLRELNESQSNRDVRISFLDAQTISFEYVKGPPMSWLFRLASISTDVDLKMRERILSTKEFCELFSLWFPVQQVHLRWADENNHTLIEMVISKEACATSSVN